MNRPVVWHIAGLITAVLWLKPAAGRLPDAAVNYNQRVRARDWSEQRLRWLKP